ncbi:hypothetical protein [Actinopolyspora halophila]|uniref:hypothetical protein n=1 Tax=Actinopolyspora halophila TaxID=1850 RepID=UPI0003717FFE|nr:hypothetical protein [Actinopolyspora halophila]
MLAAEVDARARGVSPVGRIIVGELGMEITVVSRHSAAGHHRVFPELLGGRDDDHGDGLPDLHSPEHADDALIGRHRLDPRRSSSE